MNINFESSVQIDLHPIPKPEDVIMQADLPQA